MNILRLMKPWISSTSCSGTRCRTHMTRCLYLDFILHDQGTFTHMICLNNMCRYDHQDRLTAKEAQAHPYFASVREAEARKLLTITSPVKKRNGAYEANKHNLHSYSYCSAYAGPGDVTITSTVKNPSHSLTGKSDALGISLDTSCYPGLFS